MANNANLYYDSSKAGAEDLLYFEGQLHNQPDLTLPGPPVLGYHPAVKGTFVLEMHPSELHSGAFSAPSSSSSSARRRHSSNVTAMSSQSLGSESQSSRGLSGTPEASQSGKITPTDSGWPLLNPKPSRPDSDQTLFNPIQNSYSLPPRRPRRVTNKPKPEPSDREKEAKRVHNREKNKDAAERARRKKKSYANHLEESKSELEHQNSALKLELETLADEAARIKAQLLGHVNCHDQDAGQWIDGESTQHTFKDGEHYNLTVDLLGSSSSLPFPTIQCGGFLDETSLYQQMGSQKSASPPVFEDVVYQQDASYAHSPGLYGDDHDPVFVSGPQTSMLGGPDPNSDLLGDQYADFRTDFDYIIMPGDSYQ